MVLPDISLVSQCNVYKQFSGFDHPDYHKGNNNFALYPYTIDYRYNSRGFRDTEWPVDLKTAVWCFGDSFTAGIAMPFEHTWPQILSKQLKLPTINISMDGASNDWIARKVLRVLDEVAPNNIVIHWSYIHRREKQLQFGDVVRDDLDLAAWFDAGAGDDDDINNLITNIDSIELAKSTTQVIHSFIPGCCPWNLTSTIKNRLPTNNVIAFFKQLDHGRDSLHYDIDTSNWLVKEIIKFIK